MMITADRLRGLLDYDPETGVFTWRNARRNGVTAGSVAGAKLKNGYLQIMIDRRFYKAHRLAWLYVHGEWPKADIDHVNNARDDNRLCNLREATRSENNRNMSKRSDNSSGFKGVSYFKDRGKWYARIHVNKRKQFLGYFDTPEAAHEAYCAASISLHGQFGRVV